MLSEHLDDEDDSMFGLVWFYGISTLVGYLMPNPVYIYIYIYISNIWFVNTFYRYTQLNYLTVLFLIIQFSMLTKLNGSKSC